MLRSLISSALVISTHAGSVTVSSTDLAGGSRPNLDNVKATWDTDIKLGDKKTKLSLLYDMKAKKDMVKTATLSGALESVNYALTHTFASKVTGLTLSTKASGVTLKAVGDSANQLTQVSASGGTKVGGVSVGMSPAYLVKKGLSKLSLSAAFGGGAAVTGEVVAGSGALELSSCALEYETSLGAGRALSASVNPMDSALDMTLVDKSLEPGATWVADLHAALEAKPKLTVRRAWAF